MIGWERIILDPAHSNNEWGLMYDEHQSPFILFENKVMLYDNRQKKEVSSISFGYLVIKL